MRWNKAESIGDILRQYLRQEGLETPLNETRMVAAWAEVMGPVVARYTGDVFVKNQTLYVRLKSPALKANLLMNREAIVRKLNERVGAQVIQNIVFCCGRCAVSPTNIYGRATSSAATPQRMWWRGCRRR